MLLWGCFDLNLVVKLAETGKTASLEIDYLLGEELYALTYSAEEESSLRALPLPLRREDFLALLTDFPQAELVSYQRRDNRVQAEINFSNNQEMMSFLNRQQLGVWQLTQKSLHFQLESFGDIPFSTSSHYFSIELQRPGKLIDQQEGKRKRKLKYKEYWVELAEEGLEFSATW